MTSIVIDASVAIGWLAQAQSTEAATALLVRSTVFVAPAIFVLETRNVALKLERRGLVLATETAAWLSMLSHRVDAEEARTLLDYETILPFARQQRLSFFDALYLDMARRLQCALASRDTALLEAAGRTGVATLDIR